MEPGFVLLPTWYNRLDDLKGHPTGNVLLFTDESVMFDVNIKESTNGFCISNGWPTVVSVLGIEDGDFVVFQNMDASSFRITHFKSYLHTVNSSKFHIVMLHPKLDNLLSFKCCLLCLKNLYIL
ncbi:putative transcription factor B3-Domain family [Helianthus anomalus]